MFDKSKCPLCGKSNQCAMEMRRESGVDPGPCWCVSVNFSTDLLGQLPPDVQGTACICAACARKSEQQVRLSA